MRGRRHQQRGGEQNGLAERGALQQQLGMTSLARMPAVCCAALLVARDWSRFQRAQQARYDVERLRAARALNSCLRDRIMTIQSRSAARAQLSDHSDLPAFPSGFPLREADLYDRERSILPCSSRAEWQTACCAQGSAHTSVATLVRRRSYD